MQEVTRDAELGRRLVDKLVKVWLRSGDEAWVLIHVEVQGKVERDFFERMFVYHYRLFDRYHVDVVSFAVLADTSPNWRPNSFGYGRWGCQISLQFPVVKLLDYASRWEELEASDNPFAVVVIAQLKTQTTRRDPEERSRWKLILAKGLYVRGSTREEVLDLLRFIDWLIPDYS